MSGLSQVIPKSTLILSLLAGGVIFTSCASIPSSESTNQALPKAQLNNQVADTAPAAPTEASESTSATAQAAQLTRSRPQLIKKAAIGSPLIGDLVDNIGQRIQITIMTL